MNRMVATRPHGAASNRIDSAITGGSVSRQLCPASLRPGATPSPMPRKSADKKSEANARPAQAKRALGPPKTATSAYLPSGRATLFRMEQIHDEICRVTPAGTHKVTINGLAAQLGVSRNTVKEDLGLLEIFNAPLAYDERRFTLYYTAPYALRPPLWLQPRPVLALLVAIRLAAHSRTFPMGVDLVGAWDALKPVIAGARAVGPETLDGVFSTGGMAGGEAEAAHFAALCEAINARQEVRVTYRKPQDDSAAEVRVLHPLHWYVRPDACLLIAHEPRLGARRNFELVRIEAVELTGNTFTWPAGFDLKTYLAGAFGRLVGEAVHTVRVRIEREHVPRIRERPWQHETLVELADGSAEATFHVCHTADLEQEVLRAGGAVEVLEPAELRERIKTVAERIAAKHR